MAASDNAQGYQCEFIDSVPGDFYCKKCSLVGRRLTVTSCCGESYCHACIADTQQQEKPCPECNQQSFTSFEQMKYQRRVATLQVYCSMKGRGCDWSGTLDQLDAHLDLDQDNCQYIDTKCPLNCQQTIPKNKVEQHVAKECIKRDCVCQYCSFKATYEEVVDTHLPECIYVPLQCPNLCGVSCERELMEDHISICLLEKVACEFSDVGCNGWFRREVQEEHTKQNIQEHLAMTAATSVKTNQQLQRTLHEQEQKFQEQEKQLREYEQNLREQDLKLQGTKRNSKEQMQKLEKQDEKIRDLEQKLQKLERKYLQDQDILQKSMTQLQRGYVENNLIGKVVKQFFLSHTFTMKNFSEEKAKNMSNDWKSPAMYTHPDGYKFCIGIDANGCNTTRGTSVNVELWPMSGEYDNNLPWPAEVQFTMELVNWKDGDNWVVTDTAIWNKPSMSCGLLQSFPYIPSGQHVFIEHSKLGEYLCKDTLHFKVIAIPS